MNNEERRYVVYKHTNQINNKCYIGMTRQNPPKKRWKNGTTYKSNKHFTNAINFYGWDNFRHEILFENLTKEEAEQKEIELISFYKSNQPDFGYNIANGGNCKGTVSEETKRKLSDAHMGKKLSQEHIEKIRENSKKQYTDELRRKIVESIMIPVSQYTNTGEFINEYIDAVEAGKVVDVAPTHITACCRGRRKKSKGFIWRYANETLTEEHIAWCNSVDRNYITKPVCQYDLNGVLLNTYDSRIDAMQETGVSDGSIHSCCNRITKTAGGWIWRNINDLLTKEEVEWCNESSAIKRQKAVVQYDLSGVFIKMYPSATIAKKETGCDNSEIGKCCRSEIESVKSFIWRYASDIADPYVPLFSTTSTTSPTTPILSEIA